ncbi:MAG: hypothetical protein WC528_02355 [Patescibacteria group bacterium]
MRTVHFIAMLSLVALLLLTNSCQVKPASKDPEFLNSESAAAGIVVHGYCTSGWIKNTNSYPVRIKEVWIFKGETTDWIDVFQPGEQRPQYISGQHGFHIYTLDGIEVGWIHPVRNGN